MKMKMVILRGSGASSKGGGGGDHKKHFLEKGGTFKWKPTSERIQFFRHWYIYPYIVMIVFVIIYIIRDDAPLNVFLNRYMAPYKCCESSSSS